MLEDAARFLVGLHGLPRGEIAWSGDWPRTWTAAQYADRGLAERLPLIAGRLPRLAGSVEAFFRRYRHDQPAKLVILHGDLVCDHILIDPLGSGLSGIIDFGDVALGDPAQDLLGFWSYGGRAVSRLIASYDAAAADPGLLHRSRNHFIRYRIDRLCEQLDSGVDLGGSRQLAALDALLKIPMGESSHT